MGTILLPIQTHTTTMPLDFFARGILFVFKKGNRFCSAGAVLLIGQALVVRFALVTRPISFM